MTVPDLFGLGDTPVRLDDDYRLPRDAKMVGELLAALGEAKADFVGMHTFGGSAPAEVLYEKFGITAAATVAKVKAML